MGVHRTKSTSTSLSTGVNSSNGCNNSEIASRKKSAKMSFQRMKTVLTNKYVSINTGRRAPECVNKPILMYGCEAWTVSK